MVGWWWACAEDPRSRSPNAVALEGDPVDSRSWPIEGGAAADDGRTLVAADTDHDRLVLVDFADGRVRTVQLPRGWAPRKVAIDGVIAALAADRVVTVDPETLGPRCSRPPAVRRVTSRPATPARPRRISGPEARSRCRR